MNVYWTVYNVHVPWETVIANPFLLTPVPSAEENCQHPSVVEV